MGGSYLPLCLPGRVQDFSEEKPNFAGLQTDCASIERRQLGVLPLIDAQIMAFFGYFWGSRPHPRAEDGNRDQLPLPGGQYLDMAGLIPKFDGVQFDCTHITPQ